MFVRKTDSYSAEGTQTKGCIEGRSLVAPRKCTWRKPNLDPPSLWVQAQRLFTGSAITMTRVDEFVGLVGCGNKVTGSELFRRRLSFVTSSPEKAFASYIHNGDTISCMKG